MNKKGISTIAWVIIVIIAIIVITKLLKVW